MCVLSRNQGVYLVVYHGNKHAPLIPKRAEIRKIKNEPKRTTSKTNESQPLWPCPSSAAQCPEPMSSPSISFPAWMSEKYAARTAGTRTVPHGFQVPVRVHHQGSIGSGRVCIQNSIVVLVRVRLEYGTVIKYGTVRVLVRYTTNCVSYLVPYCLFPASTVRVRYRNASSTVYSRTCRTGWPRGRAGTLKPSPALPYHRTRTVQYCTGVPACWAFASVGPAR